MLDLKNEVEAYTGTKIDINQQLERIEKKVKAKGGKLSKNHISSIKKLINKKEKRVTHKKKYMATCVEYDLSYDASEERAHYYAKHGQDKEDSEISVPLRVTIGVTVALCGLFLLFVPIHVCKKWAPYLIEIGVGLAVD